MSCRETRGPRGSYTTPLGTIPVAVFCGYERLASGLGRSPSGRSPDDGSEPAVAELERHGQDYLFRLRMTTNVKRQLPKLAAQRGWRDTGQGWHAAETRLRLGDGSRRSGACEISMPIDPRRRTARGSR